MIKNGFLLKTLASLLLVVMLASSTGMANFNKTGRKKRYGFYPLRPLQVNDDQLASFNRAFSRQLLGVDHIELLDTEDLKIARNSYEQTRLTPCQDIACMKVIATLAGVDYLIYGTLSTDRKNALIVDMKLLDTVQGNIVLHLYETIASNEEALRFFINRVVKRMTSDNPWKFYGFQGDRQPAVFAFESQERVVPEWQKIWFMGPLIAMIGALTLVTVERFQEQ